MELKGKREIFCREYLKDLNGTQAATRAGYSAHSARQTACDLLAEPEVQDRVAALAEARTQELKIEARDVLLELQRMLLADVALAFDEDTSCVKPIHEIPIDLRRTIAGFESEEIFEWMDADEAEPEDRIVERKKQREGERVKVWRGVLKKVKFWSKEKAAELLGKHLSLFLDRLKIEGLEGLAEKLAGARSRQSLV